MKCPDVRKKLIDLLHEGGDAEQDGMVRSHLQSCSECAREFERMSDAIKGLAILDDATEHPPLKTADIYARLEKSWSRRRRRSICAAEISALLVFVIALGLLSIARIDVQRSRVTISWAQHLQSAAEPRTDASIDAFNVQLRSHERRLDELDAVMQLLVSKSDADDHKFDQLAIVLAKWMRQTESSNREKWDTVSRGMHSLHLAKLNDSIQWFDEQQTEE